MESDFWNYIYDSIRIQCRRSFENRHFKESALSAFIEIEARLKNEYKKVGGKKTGQTLGGLIGDMFSEENPIIILDQDKDAHKGYKNIFDGVAQAIRNPTAHANIYQSESAAKHLIYLASLLMQKIDDGLRNNNSRATVTSSPSKTIAQHLRPRNNTQTEEDIIRGVSENGQKVIKAFLNFNKYVLDTRTLQRETGIHGQRIGGVLQGLLTNKRGARIIEKKAKGVFEFNSAVYRDAAMKVLIHGQ